MRKYDLSKLIIDAGCIYQQLCWSVNSLALHNRPPFLRFSIATFVSVYFYLLLKWTSSSRLSVLLAILVSLGYTVFWRLNPKINRNLETVTFQVRTGFVTFTFSLLLAPILHSLLATVSTDTIYALSSLFLLGNWICTDYTTQSAEYAYEPGSNTTAFSFSLLAALCLASRLPTPYHTFVLFVTEITLFGFWPFLVQLIRAHFGRSGQLALTIFSGVTANTAVWSISYHEAPLEYKRLIAVASVGSLVCLNLLGPWLLMRMQKIKRNIYGPWDEAVMQS
ncbi:unnamed protein product [Calicophoron daubneyi]|uniref:Phosphatidylinositol N-acetylglucosaminyltransferase subunit C n=1 Tax=Calicophoron daubneyi TaxID=300641 RepID=A0AAV2TUP1_CALDB